MDNGTFLGTVLLNADFGMLEDVLVGDEFDWCWFCVLSFNTSGGLK